MSWLRTLERDAYYMSRHDRQWHRHEAPSPFASVLALLVFVGIIVCTLLAGRS